MKIRVVEVGEGGTFLLPLPTSILEHLCWNDGDELILDIPFPHSDQIIIWRKETEGV